MSPVAFHLPSDADADADGWTLAAGVEALAPGVGEAAGVLVIDDWMAAGADGAAVGEQLTTSRITPAKASRPFTTWLHRCSSRCAGRACFRRRGQPRERWWRSWPA